MAYSTCSKIITGGSAKDRRLIVEQICQQFFGISWPHPHPDFLIVNQPESNSIGIEAIKKLKIKLSLKPFSAKIKLAIILTAEKLTLPAQNALLKALEEPSASSLIILVASHLESLLPTIVSRCEVIKLRSLPQIKIEPKELVFHQTLMKEILQGSPGKRLQLAGEWSKNKKEAEKLIKIHLYLLRQLLLADPGSVHAKNLHQAQKALEMLQANTNPNLTLGNLFLAYTPCLKSQTKV